MKKEFWLIIILAIIIVVLLLFLLWPVKKIKGPILINEQPKTGLLVTSPRASEEVSSPLKITGLVNGDGWSGFEGQVGTVELRDSKDEEITKGILMATTEWTSLPTDFETTLNFDVFLGWQRATLVFRNENPSGDPERDKTFILPVQILKKPK
ncbi:MAG: Gmad2 immunoglobulin-like domain-containing protein [Patescibacteria group bacterium]